MKFILNFTYFLSLSLIFSTLLFCLQTEFHGAAQAGLHLTGLRLSQGTFILARWHYFCGRRTSAARAGPAWTHSSCSSRWEEGTWETGAGEAGGGGNDFANVREPAKALGMVILCCHTTSTSCPRPVRCTQQALSKCSLDCSDTLSAASAAALKC